MIRSSAVFDNLRRADWLTAERGRIYGRMVAAMVLIQAANLTVRILRSAWSDPGFRPEATDFDAFWAAARLTWSGHAAMAYDPVSMQAAERIGAQPVPGQVFPYLNPPIFLLLCAPLGLLPYLPALFAFAAASTAAAWAGLRLILPPSWPTLTIVALPVAMLNATEGQNGALTASCYAGAMLLLGRSPALAGACLGLLACKPHLALCVPVALLAARRWHALFACAATTAGLALLAWATLGSAAWLGFFRATAMMHAVIRGDDTWPRMLSVYAALRILGQGLATAYAAQAVAAVLAACVVARIAACQPGPGAEVSAMVLGTLLCTPYVLDYDLVCLAVPMAWIAASGSTTGWLDWEKALLAVLYIFPLLSRQLNLAPGLPLTPVLLALLLALLAKRQSLSW